MRQFSDGIISYRCCAFPPGWKLRWAAMLCALMMGWMYWCPLILFGITRTGFFLLEKKQFSFQMKTKRWLKIIVVLKVAQNHCALPKLEKYMHIFMILWTNLRAPLKQHIFSILFYVRFIWEIRKGRRRVVLQPKHGSPIC